MTCPYRQRRRPQRRRAAPPIRRPGRPLARPARRLRGRRQKLRPGRQRRRTPKPRLRPVPQAGRPLARPAKRPPGRRQKLRPGRQRQRAPEPDSDRAATGTPTLTPSKLTIPAADCLFAQSPLNPKTAVGRREGDFSEFVRRITLHGRFTKRPYKEAPLPGFGRRGGS
jgi:hypothetical protein